jgi:hypothetical protein
MKGSNNLASFLYGFFAQTSDQTGWRKDTQRWRFKPLVDFSRSFMQAHVRLSSGGSLNLSIMTYQHGFRRPLLPWWLWYEVPCPCPTRFPCSNTWSFKLPQCSCNPLQGTTCMEIQQLVVFRSSQGILNRANSFICIWYHWISEDCWKCWNVGIFFWLFHNSSRVFLCSYSMQQSHLPRILFTS